MDTTRRNRSLKPTVQIVRPRCTDLAGNPAATAELVLGGVEYLARLSNLLR